MSKEEWVCYCGEFESNHSNNVIDHEFEGVMTVQKSLKKNPNLICHCGFPEINHHFKHQFEGKINVENKLFYVIDANKFPIEHKIICSFPQCKLSQKIHDSLYTPEELEIINQNGKITHEFQPQTIKERKLSFMVPLEAKCLICNKTLETHDKLPEGIKMLSSDLHSFSVPVLFLNRKPYDIITLHHPKNLNYKFSPLNEIKPEGNDQQK